MVTQPKKLDKTKIAFLTTVFPKNKSFLPSFFDSLNNQSFKNFDVIVVNDGLKNFQNYKKNFKQLNIIDINKSSTPVKNREIGINYCIKNKYDILIFGDSDDYFKKNRVEKNLELLKNNDIVVNDLSLFNEKKIIQKMYLSKRINNYKEINLEFIVNKNIFGLSNTAIKLKNLKKFNLPNNLIALDWYIFSKLLVEGKKAIFTNKTITFYRQHKNNIIGMKKMNNKLLKKSLIVKKKHYRALSKISNYFKIKLNKLKNQENNKKIDYPVWWEQN